MTMQAVVKTAPIEDAIERRVTWATSGRNPSAREAHLASLEQQRVKEVLRRRRYYAGEQYDALNWAAVEANGLRSLEDLPEHLKKHAYSTQIQDSIDFIASQLTASFGIEANSPEVDAILKTALTSSPDLSAGDDEEDLSITNVVRDALIAQDVAVHVRWDPNEGTAWFEFWDSEMVEFRYADDNRHRLESVIVTDLVWVELPDGDEGERIRTTRYEVVGGECQKTVQIDDQDPEPPEFLGLPFIPWCLIRANKKKIRTTRGESLITKQVMAAADRYNANEQLSFVISRYNSHGNLVVVGDAAVMQANEQGSVHKDVADVLTFPGGTQATVITLPTDPKMIEHQRAVLLDSLYEAFGLVRLDPTTVQGLGQVSGYALEILNRKTEGTFEQIRRWMARDLRAMLNMALDVTAYKENEEHDLAPFLTDDDDMLSVSTGGDNVVDNEVLGAAVLARMLAIDPASRFPDRKIEIRLGSGYIVDDVMIRDDFTAGLISLEEALRQRGKDDSEIQKIIDEIEARKPAEPEIGPSGAAAAAAQKALEAARQAGSSTKAGGTLSAATSERSAS